MRHTNREIEEAKMLSRRLSALGNVSVPPLSRLRIATTLFALACWVALRSAARGARRWVRDKKVCPCCEGRRQVVRHIIHDEFELAACRLCDGKGEVTWREVEAFKWGGALQRYRLNAGQSLAQMYYTIGLVPDHVHRLECGLVPLDDWPQPALSIADLQLDREASGHPSTT